MSQTILIKRCLLAVLLAATAAARTGLADPGDAAAESTAARAATVIVAEASPSANPSDGGRTAQKAPAARGASLRQAAGPSGASAAAATAAVTGPAASPADKPPAAGKATAQEVTDAMKALLDSLVQQGVLKQAQADAVLRTMETRLNGGAPPKRPPPPANPNVVGVPYVPEFVKDDIREQLRKEMRQDVMKDILAKAKKERWGLPGALPSWVNRITFSGDFRLRAQGDLFDSNNAKNYYLDFLKINQAGGIGKVDIPFLNTSVNQYRLRLRGRLGMDAVITSNIKLGLQITTGNTLNPVTFNQDLGTYGTPFQVVWNKFFLRYQSTRADGSPSFTVWGGRFPNPWLYTDLVWYHELNFQGVAATQRLYMRSPSTSPADPATGHDYLFVTLGAFPLQDIQFTTADKWLYGAQVGTDLLVQRHSVFTIGVAYYDYANITGKRNALDSRLLDYTAPEYLQKGNTLYDILNDSDPNTNLFALAADYREVDVTAKLDFSQLAPTHVTLIGDYVKNIGYNSQKVFQRTGQYVRPRTVGYQYGISVGWPQERIAEPGHWQIFGAFKHLERDAVLDAFTDSNFHLGGTDAEGYILRGELGLRKNTWLAVHWYSSNSIDGPRLSIDTLQIGILAKF